MNRKSFLKKLGAGAIVAAFVPKAINSTEPEVYCSVDPAVPGGDISVIMTNMKPSKTPLDTIIMEAKKRGYDFSESN